jgi:hypothetical protein
MKLSVEAKVAAAVAAGFLALTPGAMAQGRHKGQTGGRNDFGPTNNPGVQMHMSQQEPSKSSLFDRTNAEENRQKFSDENVTSSTRQQREDRHDARNRERERSGTNGNVRERERERSGTNGNVRERERERSGTNGNVREREREKPNGVVEEQRQEQRTNAAGKTQTRSQERTKQPQP